MAKKTSAGASVPRGPALRDPRVTRLKAPYDDVGVQVVGLSADKDVIIEYRGTPNSLVRAGAATKALVRRWSPGKTRRDEDGNRVIVEWRGSWLKLRRYCSLSKALDLPGITHAMLSAAKAESESECREQSLDQLARALEWRYPGLKVEARLRWHGDELFRTIRFDGPPPLIEGYGLAPCGFESRDYFVDETGTQIAAGWTAEGAYAVHHHEAHAGTAEGRLPSQHPDNRKVRHAVSRILAHLARAPNQ